MKEIQPSFFFAKKLPIYSSSIMAVQRIPEIKITSRFVDHLATTTSTEASRRAPPSSPLHRRSRAQLVVVDSREVVVLRPHRTSTPEQQPPLMKNNVDRLDPNRRHTNVDEQRRDPSKSTKDRSAGDTPPHAHQRC